MIANAFKSLATIFLGYALDKKDNWFLLELKHKPRPQLTPDGIASIVKYCEYKHLAYEIQSGSYISHSQLKWLCDAISEIIGITNLLDTVMHLENSYCLYWGFMVGSYYEYHYRRERESVRPYEMEKRYLENRIEYDLAFLSAFRGIETLLEKSNINKFEIPKHLKRIDAKYGTNFTDNKYTSFHEVFSGGNRKRTYVDAIENFLKLRNAVAAHGNLKPPFILMEDQVMEIQHFLRNMLSQVLNKE